MQEKHINLSLISNENSKNHYAARAIKYGHTILTNEEMEDFLSMVQTSTFAKFKTHMSPSTITTSSPTSVLRKHESMGLYFLAIVHCNDNMLPYQSINNNSSIQSNVREETFSGLYNILINISNFKIPKPNLE
jgi:hypothetical protein